MVVVRVKRVTGGGCCSEERGALVIDEGCPD